MRGSIESSSEVNTIFEASSEPVALGQNEFSDFNQSAQVADQNAQQPDRNFDLTTAEGQRQQLASGQQQREANRQRRLGSVQAVDRVGVDPDDPTSSPRSNVAIDPVQTGTASVEEDDPFGPTGFRVGIFEVQASVEQSAGYSSNLSGAAGGEAGGFSQTDVEVNLTTDWSLHEWQTNLAGSYRFPFDSSVSDELSISADTQLRLDLTDGHTLTGRGFYSAQTQEFTDTTLAPGAVDTPLTQSFGGSLEFARTDRKLVYALRGTIERNIFEDADLGGGVSQSQEDQNNNLYSFSLRTGYEVSPALTPYVEGVYSIRDFDLATDRNGNRRDSVIYELRGGVEVDLGEKVQGELSVGYVTEQFDDPLLDDLTGVTVNGELSWSPERDSLVTLTLGTETNNSIVLNDSGSFTYNARLDYERQITDRLSFDAFAGIQVETNDAENTTVEFGIGTQYWVNRFMALTGDVEYSSFSSDVANSDFNEVSGRIGVRLQR